MTTFYISSLNESKVCQVHPIDEYSNILRIVEGTKKDLGVIRTYSEGYNHNFIVEGSFSRLISNFRNEKLTCAIITASRKSFNLPTNKARNAKLRAALREHGIGVYFLVGHWRECTAKDNEGNPIPYPECPADKLVDSIERSFAVIKPANMSTEKFVKLLTELMTIDGETQDAIIIKYAKDNDINHAPGYFLRFSNGSEDKIGEDATIDKISQAYSQYVHKKDIPFIFEGIESPASNFGSQMFQSQGVLYNL